MKQIRFTKPPRIFAGLLVGLAMVITSTPLVAGTLASGTRPFYDQRQEITFSATVSSVVAKPARGIMPGSHLVLNTSSGPVDASLGRFGLTGKGALSVRAGQQVEVTGVVKIVRNKQILIVRNVKVGSQIYQIRNQYGIPVSPQARTRINQKATVKGEAL
ncbi:MAG TPA: hypothetical protein VMH04_23165 [Candidatus Solibacter sp.]|nr:hypothetical protein [Candidatus Solibacter sp.]